MSNYCTKIKLTERVRVDLFTPTMFRLRIAKFETNGIPDCYDIPFCVGKTTPWDEVKYELEEVGNVFVIRTEKINIFINKNCFYIRYFRFIVEDKQGNRLYPSDKNQYGMFSNKCIAFDSANFFEEDTSCDRHAKWFYNPETKEYDIFLKDNLLDRYFIYATTYKEGYKQFTELVGAEPMLTRKGYGYYQTQYLANNGSSESLIKTAKTLREKNIPCDTLIIDLDWGDGVINGQNVRWGDGIDWDTAFTSPMKPKEWLGKLKDDDFEVMIIHHSIPNYENRCDESWVQTEHEAEFWWKKLKDKFDEGIIGTWQDTRKNDITDARIYKGMQDLLGDKKRCTLMGNYELWQDCGWTRDCKMTPIFQKVGGRRYPFKWTGDMDCNKWDELEFQIKGVTNLQGALKGVSYITNDASVNFGTDIAIRSIQFLAFNSITRSHNAKPWQDECVGHTLSDMMAITGNEGNGKCADAADIDKIIGLLDQDSVKEEGIKKVLELRYRLMPYIYTLAHETYATGVPFTRPMMVEFEDDDFCNENQFPLQYMFGSELLVAPVYSAASSRKVYLPQGYDWIDFWTGEVIKGGQIIEVDTTDLMKFPLYVKSGSIIPMQKESTSLSHGEKLDTLYLNIYPGNDYSYELYEDDGISLNYQKNIFATTTIRTQKNDGITLNIASPVGEYKELPQERKIVATFINEGGKNYTVSGADATCETIGNDLKVTFTMKTQDGATITLKSGDFMKY
ncbi:MAG: DUF5110 domain-containing protein [Ruminococcaceae bacterium]|nr:DUF5110 domain-containing protein [Oscillospiraceae bacterium]